MSEQEIDGKTGQQIERLTLESMQFKATPDGGLAAVLPPGCTLQEMKPLETKLPFVVQTEMMLTTSSFCHYVNRFKRSETQIFGDYQVPKLVARIDYHKPGLGETSRHDAQNCAHNVEYRPPWSDQWARWREIDSRPISQADFAEFIEENYMDIRDPDHAELLDMVSNLAARKRVNFTSGVRLQDGSNELQWGETVDAKVGKGSVVVPPAFELGIPILFDGQPYKIKVHLRYRISDGVLVFICKISRRRFMEQTAFEDILIEVEKETEITVYRGKTD